VQFPEWSDWLKRMKNQSPEKFEKKGFDADFLNRFASTSADGCTPSAGKIHSYSKFTSTVGQNAVAVGSSTIAMVG